MLPTALNPDFRLKRYGKNLKQEHFIQEKYEKICIIGKKAVPLHSLLKSNDIGAIAQLVEQRTENPCVPGSIPGGTTATSKRVIHMGDSFFWYDGISYQKTRSTRPRACEKYVHTWTHLAINPASLLEQKQLCFKNNMRLKSAKNCSWP